MKLLCKSNNVIRANLTVGKYYECSIGEVGIKLHSSRKGNLTYNIVDDNGVWVWFHDNPNVQKFGWHIWGLFHTPQQVRKLKLKKIKKT